MDRRKFLQTASINFAGSCLFFSSCKTTEIQEVNGEIRVPLSRLKKDNFLVISTADKQRILITRIDKEYKALSMRCTHRGAWLNVEEGQLVCPSHGSVFGMDGKVLSSPAINPLKNFPVNILNEMLIIHVA
jgi:nitrite reductase/ring-hydroxylating ferredoxin subunit